MKLTYYRELDGIRALAALIVLLTHFYTYFRPLSWTNLTGKVGLFGHCGVSIFFVLSGYLITRILLSTKDQKGYFYNFYIRRTLRIFPLYYFFLLFFYFIFPFVIDEPVISLSQQLYYWFYLQDFALTFNWNAKGLELFWTLAVEEHFYLFWPFLIYYLPKKHILKVIIAIVAVSIVIRLILTANGYVVYYFTFSRMDELALGSLLAYLNLGEPNPKVAKLCLGVFSLTMLPSFILWFKFSGQPGMQVLKYPIIAIGFSCFIGYVLSVSKGHPLKWVLQNPFLSYTGKISYGLYIYHTICFLLIFKYLNTGLPVVNFLLSFSLVYLIAGLSYKYFESPLLRLKDRFRYKDPERKPQPTLQVQ